MGEKNELLNGFITEKRAFTFESDFILLFISNKYEKSTLYTQTLAKLQNEIYQKLINFN